MRHKLFVTPEPTEGKIIIAKPKTNGRNSGKKSIGSALAICRQTREAIYQVAAKPAIPCPTLMSLPHKGIISSYNCSRIV